MVVQQRPLVIADVLIRLDQRQRTIGHLNEVAAFVEGPRSLQGGELRDTEVVTTAVEVRIDKARITRDVVGGVTRRIGQQREQRPERISSDHQPVQYCQVVGVVVQQLGRRVTIVREAARREQAGLDEVQRGRVIIVQPEERAVLVDDIVAQHRIGEGQPVRLNVRCDVSHELCHLRAVQPRHDTRGLRRGQRFAHCIGGIGQVERQRRSGRGVVVGHRVVADNHPQGVLDGDTTAGQARGVVVNHIVGDQHVVPGIDRIQAAGDIHAVGLMDADTAAVARTGEVAADEVGVDGDGARAGAQQKPGDRLWRQARLAADEDAAAVNRVGLGERLVEVNDVIFYLSPVRPTQVADAGTVALAVVAADPVLLDPVLICTRVQGDTGTRAAEGIAVLGDVVVVDTDPIIHRVGVVQSANLIDESRMADPDAAAVEAGVGGEAVVADIEELIIAVGHNSTALAGADDGEAVDTRTAVLRTAEAVKPDSLAGDENTRTLLGSEIRRTQCREAYCAQLLARQQIDVAVTYQQVDLGTPGLDLLGRHLAGVEGHGPRAPALEFDRLVHDGQLVVNAGRHQDQVAGVSELDGVLDGGEAAVTDSEHIVELIHTVRRAVAVGTDSILRAADIDANRQGHTDRRLDRCRHTALAGHDDLVVTRRLAGIHLGIDTCSTPVDDIEVGNFVAIGVLQMHRARATTEVVVAGDKALRLGNAIPLGIGHLYRTAHGQDTDLLGIGHSAAGSDEGTTAAAVVAPLHPLNHGCPIRALAVHREADGIGEGRDGDHRGVQVGDGARHVLEGIAELTELRVEERIDDKLRRIPPWHKSRIRDRARIVHTGDDHIRRHARGLRQVGRIGGRQQGVELAVLVRIDAGHLGTVPVVEADRGKGRCILLAEGRGVRVEFVGQVVQRHAGDIARNGHVGHDHEVDGGVLRAGQLQLLAVAEGTCLAGKGRGGVGGVDAID